MRNPSTFDDHIEQQAIAWFARMSGGSAGWIDRLRFRAWLRADARHEQAYAELDKLWAHTQGPAEVLGAGAWYRPAPSIRPSRLQSALPMAAAACLLVLVVGVLLWRDPGIVDRTLADQATAPGEQRRFSLADGSSVLLDGDSALNVHYSKMQRQLELVRGRAWFDVEPDSERPFQVRSGETTARVLGTAFAVTYDAERISVTVEHGKVAVSGDDSEWKLSKGNQIILSGTESTRVTQVDVGNELAWRRGLLVLDRSHLSHVIHELDRLSPERVVLANADLADQTLSGVFRIDDPEAILQALKSGLGIEATRIPGVVTVLHH